MAPSKKVTNCVTFKGKAKATAGGTTSKQINSQPLAEGTASATSQKSSVGTQPPQQEEGPLFQMLQEMEQQQQKSEREREQMILDHDNIFCEQEKLKLLNQ